MGMFDSVWFPCPSTGCDGTIEVQSKAGECFMASFSPDDVPVEIAADIAGDIGSCSTCGGIYVVAKSLPDRVAVRLITENDEAPCRHCGK